jgi:glycosyltransferase involved in cell wall biosynthesis
MRDDLRETIMSVAQQNYPSLEYVVVDGASTDGSVDVIRELSNYVHQWVSEPDRSLYDGMNKGVRLATGEWLIFLNSGDQLYAADTIRSVFEDPSVDEADLVYGNAEWVYPREGIRRLIPAEPLATLRYRMNCSHQAVFARREILLKHPFSVDLLSADYEFLVAASIAGYRFKLFDRMISRCKAGGRSDVQRMRSLVDRYRILSRRGLMTPGLAAAYVYFGVLGLVGKAARRLLPTRLTSVLLKWKHGIRIARN